MRRDDVPLTDAPAGERPGPPGLVLVFGLAVLGVIIWRLADVLLLALGSVLVAVLLHALAAPMQKRLGWRRPVALTAAVVATTLFSAGALWLFGQQIVVQIDTLTQLMPRAWSAVRQQLATTPFGAYVLEDLQRLRQSPGGVVSLGSQLIRGSAGAAAATLIVVFAGLYLAFHPRTYLGGLLRLVPLNLRPRAEAVLLACGDALNRWLTAQLASMLFIGVTVALGLWLAGVPSPTYAPSALPTSPPRIPRLTMPSSPAYCTATVPATSPTRCAPKKPAAGGRGVGTSSTLANPQGGRLPRLRPS